MMITIETRYTKSKGLRASQSHIVVKLKDIDKEIHSGTTNVNVKFQNTTAHVTCNCDGINSSEVVESV